MAGAYSSAYSSAYDVGAGTQNLAGTTFTKAPSFFTGQLVYEQALTGTTFVKAPTFSQGTLLAGSVLTGVLFTKAPTFSVGEITGADLLLQGTLFTKAPSFFTGTVGGGTQALTGNQFQINPVFNGGLIFAAGAGGTAQSATDEGLRFEVWTLPQLGSFTRKYDLTRWVNAYTVSDKFGEISDGRLTIAESLPTAKLDQLIKVDRDDHSNDEGSVIRVLRGTTPVMHYVTKQFDDTWSSDDPTANLSLEGMELLLDRAIVPRKDYPAVPSVEPDWIYGALSILVNTDFDDPAVTSSVMSLEINATAGTFKIQTSYPNGDPFISTANIPFNATAQNIADAIEAAGDLADVHVTGDVGGPFLIEVLDPEAANITWATDSGLLTGLASFETVTAGGNIAAEPWAESRNPTSGVLHGNYETFAITTEQFRSSPYSLKVDGGPPATAGDFPGAQQLLSVTGGRTFRASVWVRPTQTGPFRFVIRTRDETFIAQHEATLTANAWQEMSIPSVTIPTHVSQIIFRIASISSADEPAWYVDDALFAPGADAATYGAIMSDILAPIQANGVLTWLTPTWTDTHDSSGVAWDRDLEWSIKRGQTVLQLMEYARRWNYEWRIRWDTDHFEWDLFNPTNGGTDHTGTGLAITGKSGVTTADGDSRKFPEASYYQAEGEGGQWGEHSDATMQGAWGRLEQYFANAQGLDAAGLEELATRLVADSINKTDGLSIRLQIPTALPWSKFQPGDVLKINLAPQREGEYLRCMGIVASQGPDDSAPTYACHFGSMVYQGEAAVLQTLRILWRAFRALQAPAATREISNPVQETIPPRPSGGNFIFIAASNSRPDLISTADYLCDGQDDDVEWQAAIDFIREWGGIIVACAGDFYFGSTVVIEDMHGSITFLGDGQAAIHHTATIASAGNPGYSGAGNQGRWLFRTTNPVAGSLSPALPFLVFDGLAFMGDAVAEAAGIEIAGPNLKPHTIIRNCHFEDIDNRFIRADTGNGERFEITSCNFVDSDIAGGGVEGPSMAAIQFNSGNANYHTWIHHCNFDNIQIPAHFVSIVQLDPSSTVGNSISDNIAKDCDTPVFSADAVYNNWINGTFTP